MNGKEKENENDMEGRRQGGGNLTQWCSKEAHVACTQRERERGGKWTKKSVDEKRREKEGRTFTAHTHSKTESD